MPRNCLVLTRQIPLHQLFVFAHGGL